jgi:hypothetical protein
VVTTVVMELSDEARWGAGLSQGHTVLLSSPVAKWRRACVSAPPPEPLGKNLLFS